MFENKFKNTKVIITGHTGFKGSWLSLWLTFLGAKVYGISHELPSKPCHFSSVNSNKSIKDCRFNISNKEKLDEFFKKIKPDFVFHLAAQSLVRRSYSSPIETWQTNTIGTINVLDTLKNLKKKCVAIFITSDKCYNNVEWEWGYRETDQLGGPDPYSASKGAAEFAIRSYVQSFFKKNDMIRIGIGRAGNVIGGGDWADDRIVPDCIRATILNKNVFIRNPKSTRPWQHVLEPLGGYLTLAYHLSKDSKLHGEAFNFGPQATQDSSVADLVSEMSKHWDKIKWENIDISDQNINESYLLKLNCDKALHHLNWEAKWEFHTTVRETTVWYKKFYEGASENMYEFSINQIKKYMRSIEGNI